MLDVVIERDGGPRPRPAPAERRRRAPDVMLGGSQAAVERPIRPSRAVPFTGECPVNFDGQEQIYEFSTRGRRAHRLVRGRDRPVESAVHCCRRRRRRATALTGRVRDAAGRAPHEPKAALRTHGVRSGGHTPDREHVEGWDRRIAPRTTSELAPAPRSTGQGKTRDRPNGTGSANNAMIRTPRIGKIQNRTPNAAPTTRPASQCAFHDPTDPRSVLLWHSKL